MLWTRKRDRGLAIARSLRQLRRLPVVDAQPRFGDAEDQGAEGGGVGFVFSAAIADPAFERKGAVPFLPAGDVFLNRGNVALRLAEGGLVVLEFLPEKLHAHRAVE